MNWVSPIKDKQTLNNFRTALKDYDIKYSIMFEIGIGTGLQLQDILLLKVKDVKGKDEISVRIGTRHIPTVFRLPDDLKQLISDFIQGKNPEEYLIRGHLSSEAPLTREQAYRVFRAAGKSIGLNSIGAQTMRKTFAYNYYKKTGDIYYLQNLFNHASPSITYRYIGEKPNIEIILNKLTTEENKRSWNSLKTNDSGRKRILAICDFLSEMEQSISNEQTPLEYYGKADSFLDEIEEMIGAFKKC